MRETVAVAQVFYRILGLLFSNEVSVMGEHDI